MRLPQEEACFDYDDDDNDDDDDGGDSDLPGAKVELAVREGHCQVGTKEARLPLVRKCYLD